MFPVVAKGHDWLTVKYVKALDWEKVRKSRQVSQNEYHMWTAPYGLFVVYKVQRGLIPHLIVNIEFLNLIHIPINK